MLTVVPPPDAAVGAVVASERIRLLMATALSDPESIPTTNAMTTGTVHALDTRRWSRAGAAGGR